MRATDKPKTFSVLVYDMYDYGDVATVNGFKTFEAAREYARRRTRDSVENERRSSTDAKGLRDRWFMFGEDCQVIGGEKYSGEEELDFFNADPATPGERNWLSLTPRE
jgi:hypothetical protein